MSTMVKCRTDIRPLSAELQKKAETELNEDPERVADDIQHLREWIKKQPHLTARQDDHFLLTFLRGSKFSVQKAKEKIDRYCSVRTLMPEYFNNRDPFDSSIQETLRSGVVLSLSQPNGVAGTSIILLRFNDSNPTVTSIQSIITVFYMVLDILINEDDNTAIAGIQCLVDYDGFIAGYLLQLSPAIIHRGVTIIQTAYPIRLKKLGYMNLPTVFESILVLLKKFFTEKIKNRISIYSSKDILSASGIPQSILPVEYGGTGESIKDITDKWKKRVESYKEFFEHDSKYRSDESLRPDVSDGDSFGVEGTFRRLNID